jgi:hypothetical protein
VIDQIRMHFKNPETVLPFFSVYPKTKPMIAFPDPGPEEEPVCRTVWEDRLCAD